MNHSEPLCSRRILTNTAFAFASLWAVSDLYAIESTQAWLRWQDQFGNDRTAHVASPGGALSLDTHDLSLPQGSTASGEVHVSPGYFKFQGQATTSPDDGAQSLTFSGTVTDVISVSVAPKSSGSIQFLARVDGSFNPDSAVAEPNANSAAVWGSLRVHVTGSTSWNIHSTASSIGFDNAGTSGAWDWSLAPYDEIPLNHALPNYIYPSNPDNTVDTGLQVVTFNYSNVSELISGDIYFAVNGVFNAIVRGTSSADFMNTMSLDVFVPQGTSFSTASGYTDYIHQTSVPEGSNTFLLLGLASVGLFAVRPLRLR